MTDAPNWANRTVWTGDNLDILRGMNSDTVDLIYLDPPFNSNKDYAAPVGSEAAGAAFKDTWSLSDLDVAWMGLVADEEPEVADLLETAGRTHSKGMQSYLTMMAVRLLEMRRVLKDTGSIYLHCDPTASHYLKALMDAILGRNQFRNEIIWERTTGRKAGRQYGRAHDTILFYTASSKSTWEAPTVPQTETTVKGHDLMQDDGGLYRLSDLSGAGAGPERRFGDREIAPPVGRHWMFDQAGIDQLSQEGRISFSRNGRPRLKTYLRDLPGISVRDIWTDIQPINAAAEERVGYPTQKPLALLERIIAASSNEGDVVLDPFCGCATACVAAEKLERQWVGIDLSEKAVELVNLRLRGALGDLFHYGFVTTRTDIPRRTDIDAPKNYRQNAHVLYGEQEGCCAGCGTHFEFRHFEVDHVIPRSRGGTDHIENLQLLCGSCNRIKGDRPQEYLVARLAEIVG